MKEIRRLAVSDPTDGFSEEISRHYLFIDRLNSFNLSESIGFFFAHVSIHRSGKRQLFAFNTIDFRNLKSVVHR